MVVSSCKIGAGDVACVLGNKYHEVCNMYVLQSVRLDNIHCTAQNMRPRPPVVPVYASGCYVTPKYM